MSDGTEDGTRSPPDPAQTPQLVLDFPARPALGRTDFLVAPCNAAAVAWIDRWPDWPGPTLALVGPPGCGKTHLAHVLAARAGAHILDRPDAVRLAEAMDWVAGRAPPTPIVVEMEEGSPALSAAVERALFHLLNVVRESGGWVLLTASQPPARWDVSLPDLRSRLAALPVAEITGPDEMLLEMVLIKLFADRQVIVPPGVTRYLSRRIERSFAAARSTVAQLDALAWGRGRRIGLALARELIEGTGRAQAESDPRDE